MEKSPSPVYGARLELVYGLIAHRGFESLLLRQEKEPAFKLVLFLLSEKLKKGFERVGSEWQPGGLSEPTLTEPAGEISNPSFSAKKETSFVYQDKRGFFMLFGAK